MQTVRQATFNTPPRLRMNSRAHDESSAAFTEFSILHLQTILLNQHSSPPPQESPHTTYIKATTSHPASSTNSPAVISLMDAARRWMNRTNCCEVVPK